MYPRTSVYSTRIPKARTHPPHRPNQSNLSEKLTQKPKLNRHKTARTELRPSYPEPYPQRRKDSLPTPHPTSPNPPHKSSNETKRKEKNTQSRRYNPLFLQIPPQKTHTLSIKMPRSAANCPNLPACQPDKSSKVTNAKAVLIHTHTSSCLSPTLQGETDKPEP